MIKITENELKSLKDLQAKQDQNAMVVGIATIEFLERALNMVAVVRKTRKEQEDSGKFILKTHGLDADKNNYTIDFTTGAIKQLVVGQNGVANYIDISEVTEEAR